MKFKLEIECDNAAFGKNAQEVGDEVLSILEDLCKRVEVFGVGVGSLYKLYDGNGNCVGEAKVVGK